MSDYWGWWLPECEATCPDCDETVQGREDVESLLDAIDKHACKEEAPQG